MQAVFSLGTGKRGRPLRPRQRLKTMAAPEVSSSLRNMGGYIKLANIKVKKVKAWSKIS